MVVTDIGFAPFRQIDGMTTETLLIRAASVADAPVLAWFGATTFMATYAGAVPDDTLSAYVREAFTSNRMTAEITDHSTRVLVAETGRAVIGYTVLRSSVAPGFVPGEDPVELGRIYVAPTAQRSGVGSRLLVSSLEHARATGHDWIWLTVWENNPNAIAAYLRWGFAQVGAVRFPFGDEVHRDLVMARKVDQP